MQAIPDRAQVLVVGGGPAGSTAATLLAQQGVDVVCLERDVFPRYHIGESLLPSALEVFDLLGVREEIEAAAFVRKPGAEAYWGDELWRLNFGELTGSNLHSFQVERAEFDHLLLRNSARHGAQVFEGCEITAIEWRDGVPRSASWKDGNGGGTGTLAYDFLIDGSGRSGLVSTRYSKNRFYHESFKNIAIWGYWEGLEDPDDDFEGAIRLGSIPEGWVWIIPLKRGLTSVGLVIHKDYYQAQRRNGSTDSVYHEGLRESEFAASILARGRLATDLRVETDYSYGSSRFSGENYFVCGDAACFLDPLLSTGVHLATFSAVLAAAALGTTMRGELPAERCRNYFETTYQKAYLRLLVMVAAFYDQNRGKRGYFWEAQRLTRGDVQGFDMRQAFLHLVTGTQDFDESMRFGNLEDIQAAVAAGLRENLALRHDKAALGRFLEDGTQQQRLETSHAFMSQMEGLFALSPRDSVDNIYLVTEPRLGLAQVAPF